MALSYGEGIYGDGAGVVTPLDHRLAQIGPYTKTTTANTIRPGIFYNGTTSIVTGAANMSYNVAAFAAVSTRGATQGVVPFANNASANVVTTAAPGSNSRYDVVYAWPRDFAIDGSNSTPVLGVENGTPAASPTVPSIAGYPGAIELARILVPAGVTATNSGTTFTQTAPFTSVDGAPVPFRNKTNMDLWTTALTGQRAFDISTNRLYWYTGSAWSLIPYLSMVARRASTQSIATATETLIDWDTFDYTTGEFTESAGVLTCVTAGTYWIHATVSYDNNSANSRYLIARRTASGGGSAVSLQESSLAAVSSTYDSSVPVGISAAFTAGQELRIYAFHNQGGALNLNVAALRMERIA